MPFAKWPSSPDSPAVHAPDGGLASLADPARNPAGPVLQSPALSAVPDPDENPYTGLIVGMINRLDEPDRAQWLRLALGLTVTAVEAERAVLLETREGGEVQVVCTFGGTPGEDPLLRSLPHVEAILRSRDALLIPGHGPAPAHGSALGLDHGMAGTQTAAGGGQPRSHATICAPLVRDQRIRGILLLESERTTFRPGDLTLVRAVARRLLDPMLALVQSAPRRSPVLDPVVGSTPHGYGNLIARSRSMQEIFELIDRIAATDHPVIISGESGTGKELVARAIHFQGRRREKPFIAENCAALSDSLLEAELFGYVKGAFTGADRDRKGFFELADGGTLFLDEIGEMSENMQKDLLRVLQEGEVRPVGGKKVIRVDVRIICASNRDLTAMVRDGSFRKDFFYRLNVMTVELPPLRDRREDIPLLVDRFLDNIARDTGMPKKDLGPGVLEALREYDWPGNIRELKNEIKRMVALSRSEEIQTSDLRHRPAGPGSPRREKTGSPGIGDFLPLSELERHHVLEALRRTDGNKARAAELLGINKATVFRKLKSYGML